MKILALDLAFRTGFACGEAGGKPRLDVWTLKKPGQSVEVGARNFGRTLHNTLEVERPDLIVAERYMNLGASRNDAANEAQLHLHGALEGIAGLFDIPTVKPTTATFRAHFCGRSTAAPRRRRGHKRTMEERNADRAATNAMVVKQAIVMGYLPRGSTDGDKANAAGLWDWGSAVHGRKTPGNWRFFGEEPTEAPQ